MNILCLNTAFPEAHIALSFYGKNYFERIDSNSKHSENLLVAVEKLFEKADSKMTGSEILKKLDVIAVVIGPGSFTGIRIAVSTAKALLVTNPNIKAVGINSLELIAYETENKSKLTANVTPVIDALSGLFFVAEFDKNLKCISRPKMINEKELQKFNQLISNDKSLVEKDNYYELTPETLLQTAEKKIKDNDFIKENDLSPLYLRPSQAEANFKNANKN